MTDFLHRGVDMDMDPDVAREEAERDADEASGTLPGPITKDYAFRVNVPSGYRDGRILAEEPWKRESTELLECDVTVNRHGSATVQGAVRYTVKGNKAHDIVRKIEGAAKRNEIEIDHLTVKQQ